MNAAQPAPRPQRPATDGLVLAGGLGRRMGGLDKGLQTFRGELLVRHALQRLAPQVDRVMVNANRHPADYAALGVPVWPDAWPGFAGPLAGFLTGLTRLQGEWLVTVPCDCPAFPEDLVERLAAADAPVAVPLSVAADGHEQLQPVFCRMHRSVADSVRDCLARGEHRVEHWLLRHAAARVRFDRPGDSAAFFNANTPQDLLR